MTDKKVHNFLTKLSKLLKQYDAQLYATIDEDGVHVMIGEREIVLGYADSESVEKEAGGYGN